MKREIGSKINFRIKLPVILSNVPIQQERKTERERERERETETVCVCVCERERERLLRREAVTLVGKTFLLMRQTFKVNYSFKTINFGKCKSKLFDVMLLE